MTIYETVYGQRQLKGWAWALGAAAFIVAVAIAVAIPLFLGIAAFETRACDTMWQDFTHEWHFFGGCLVDLDGTWYPEDVVRSLIAP